MDRSQSTIHAVSWLYENGLGSFCDAPCFHLWKDSPFFYHFSGCENNRREEVGDKTKKVKQKLLEEMLRQKHELERKQAERQKVTAEEFFTWAPKH